MITHLSAKLKNKCAQLLKDQKGSILVQTALIGTVLVGMLGVGVDFGRAYLYRAKLSGALDAAALAGSKAFHSDSRDAEIRAFFNSNFDGDFMNGQVAELQITEIDAVDRTLSVTTSGTLDTVFMRLFGFDDISVAAAAETTSKRTGLQLVMVLDNTGSMSNTDGGVVRIDALKTASKTMVNSLFGNDASNEHLEISIVPYVTTVNVGHLLPDNMIDTSDVPSTYTLSHTDNSKWYGCVEARATNSDLNGSAALDVKVEHDGNDWKPFLWPPHYDNVYSIDGLDGPNDEVWKEPNNYYHGENGKNSNDDGPNVNCPAPVLDFTSTKSDLITYIDDNLKYSYGTGGTIANLGMVWGWRMLHTGSPFFNDVEYDDDRMVKAAVLMTDGYNWIVNGKPIDYEYDRRDRSSDNNDAYDDDGDGLCPKCPGPQVYDYVRVCYWWGCQYENKLVSGPGYDSDDENVGYNMSGDYSGYGYRSDGRLDGATSSSGTQDAINARLANVCAAMKGMGITLYTITFGEDINGGDANAIELRNLYQGCATDSGKYFHAPTASQLDGAFEAIANDLTDLRLSK